MAKRTRRNHSLAFKSKVAFAVVKGEQTLAELAQQYEEVYLHAYASVREARAGIGRYINFYNLIRPHSSLGRQTPDQLYAPPPSRFSQRHSSDAQST